MNLFKETLVDFPVWFDFLFLKGFVSGKFLEKGKYKNAQNGNQFFNPADFRVGKDVVINGYSFKISTCDLFTQKWYEHNFREMIPDEAVEQY